MTFFHVWLACMLAAAPEGRELAVVDRAADFKLINQDEKSCSLSDYRGKVVLVSFIFTTCSGSCPATTHRMGQIQGDLKRQGLLDGGRVHLLSITLDPKRDTPDVLRRYMNIYDADPRSWSFVTGDPGAVQKTVAAWKMWARPSENGQLDHPSRIFLVDQQGRIREIYNLDFLKSPWVIEDVKLLLREGASP